MKDSRPAACPILIFWIIPIIAIPRPKKTLKTMPSAASSFSRVVLRMNRIHPVPIKPDINPPIRSPSRDLPVPPQEVMTMKAIPIPGSVAWLIASPIRDRFLNRINVPIIPAASPRSMVPITTTRVL